MVERQAIRLRDEPKRLNGHSSAAAITMVAGSSFARAARVEGHLRVDGQWNELPRRRTPVIGDFAHLIRLQQVVQAAEAKQAKKKPSPVSIALLSALGWLFLSAFAASGFVRLALWLRGMGGASLGVMLAVLGGPVILLAGFALVAAVGFFGKAGRATRSNHGAEHQVIAAFRADPVHWRESVAKQRKEQPNCGTAFVASLISLAYLTAAFCSLALSQETAFSLAWLIVLILPGVVPVLSRNRWTGPVVSAPGLLLQRITTTNPGKDNHALAVAALEELLRLEGKAAGSNAPG